MSELYVLSTWAEWQTADSVYSANLRYRGSDRGGGRRWEEVGGTRCGLDVPVEFPLGEEFPNLDP
jgi:hypothetical protein